MGKIQIVVYILSGIGIAVGLYLCMDRSPSKEKMEKNHEGIGSIMLILSMFAMMGNVIVSNFIK